MLIAKSLAVALLYALVAWGGHLFLGQQPMLELWRPATGLALALVVLGGPRMAWAVLAGALAAAWLGHGGSWDAVAFSLGGVFTPIVGAWLLRQQSNFDPRLGRLRDYLRLMLWGGVMGSADGAPADAHRSHGHLHQPVEPDGLCVGDMKRAVALRALEHRFDG